MLDTSAFVLAKTVTEILEDPAWLLGLIFLGLGVAGLLVMLSPVELRWPQPQEAAAPVELVTPEEGHPTPSVYVQVGVFLAAITAVEVIFYYIDLAQGALLAILLTLSALKFVIVGLWFMHLRFDNRMFSILFSGGLALVLALFVVVLATLGANLV